MYALTSLGTWPDQRSAVGKKNPRYRRPAEVDHSAAAWPICVFDWIPRAAGLIGLMRPQLLSLPPWARLCSRPISPQPQLGTASGGRNSVWTASLRRSPLCADVRRMPLSVGGGHIQQRRGITQAYIQRMKDAEAEWKRHAEEIKAGKRISFAQHLEQRGLLHDVVG